MTLDQFITKYIGDFVDFDGRWGPQCMDVYRLYVEEVLGFPQSPPVPSAKDVWNTYLSDYFTRVPNTPKNVPPPGAIVIWSGAYGEHGHIAVRYSLAANVNKFVSFDQNSPLGTPCHLQHHSYRAVLGWLQPKPS